MMTRQAWQGAAKLAWYCHVSSLRLLGLAKKPAFDALPAELIVKILEHFSPAECERLLRVSKRHTWRIAVYEQLVRKLGLVMLSWDEMDGELITQLGRDPFIRKQRALAAILKSRALAAVSESNNHHLGFFVEEIVLYMSPNYERVRPRPSGAVIALDELGGLFPRLQRINTLPAERYMTSALSRKLARLSQGAQRPLVSSMHDGWRQRPQVHVQRYPIQHDLASNFGITLSSSAWPFRTHMTEVMQELFLDLSLRPPLVTDGHPVHIQFQTRHFNSAQSVDQVHAAFCAHAALFLESLRPYLPRLRSLVIPPPHGAHARANATLALSSSIPPLKAWLERDDTSLRYTSAPR